MSHIMAKLSWQTRGERSWPFLSNQRCSHRSWEIPLKEFPDKIPPKDQIQPLEQNVGSRIHTPSHMAVGFLFPHYNWWSSWINIPSSLCCDAWAMRKSCCFHFLSLDIPESWFGFFSIPPCSSKHAALAQPNPAPLHLCKAKQDKGKTGTQPQIAAICPPFSGLELNTGGEFGKWDNYSSHSSLWLPSCEIQARVLLGFEPHRESNCSPHTGTSIYLSF